MFCSCGHLMHQSKSDHLLLLKVLVCCWQAQIWCHRHFSVSTRTVFQQVSYDEHFQSPAVSLPVLIQTKQTQLESVFVLLAVTSSATGYILQFIWKPLFAYGASLKNQNRVRRLQQTAAGRRVEAMLCIQAGTATIKHSLLQLASAATERS